MNTLKFKKSIHVKILCGFYYLVSALLFFAGIAYCFLSDLIKSSFTDNAIIQKMTTKEFILYGVVIVAISLLESFLAYNLQRIKKWARIIAFVISSLGLLWAIVGIFVYGGLENLFFIGLHIYFIWILNKRYYGRNNTTE